MRWDELEQEYTKWLELEDRDLLRLVYAACIATRFIEGKPVWLIVIGPSGCGKTEILESLEGQRFIIARDSITAVGLATAADGAESLLTRLDRKVLIIRDMSSITSLHAEQKVQLFSFLRAAYDGKFVRTTGRKEIEWEGKFGIIGAATDAIEREQTMASQLGERFLYIRMKLPSPNKLLDKVIQNVTEHKSMTRHLKRIVERYWSEFQLPTSHKLAKDLVAYATQGASIVAKCRSSIQRDPYTKHITFPITDTEIPTRVLQQLILLGLGLRATGADDAQIKRVYKRLIVDCIPYTRLRVLKAIAEGYGRSTSEISRYVKISQPVTLRHLEELEGLGIIARDNDWTITLPGLEEVLK